MKEVLSTTPVACSTLSTHLLPTSLLRPIPQDSNEVFGFPVGEYIVLLYTRMHVAQHVPLYPAALGSCLSTRHIEPRRPRRRKNETDTSRASLRLTFYSPHPRGCWTNTAQLSPLHTC